MARMTSLLVATALLFGVVVAQTRCGRQASETDMELLPARTSSPDTSGITDAIRQNGGNVFVQLTAEANAPAVDALRLAGLKAPAGYDMPGPIVFTKISPLTVWGFVPAGGVKKIAELNFVTRIESSADRDGIFPH